MELLIIAAITAVVLRVWHGLKARYANRCPITGVPVKPRRRAA